MNRQPFTGSHTSVLASCKSSLLVKLIPHTPVQYHFNPIFSYITNYKAFSLYLWYVNRARKSEELGKQCEQFTEIRYTLTSAGGYKHNVIHVCQGSSNVNNPY